MPEPSTRRVRGEADEALGANWLAVLEAGTTVEELRAQIEALPPDQAASGIRGLGAGDPAVPLLASLAQAAPRGMAEAAVETLGEIPTPAAAAALDEVARTASDKTLQKAARRALFRLSSQGIRVEASAPVTVSLTPPREATLAHVVASAYDGTGTRSMWLEAERPMGGIYMVAVTLNDVEGLTDVVGRDTTHKRFAEQATSMREKDPMAWVDVPPDYARQLIQEGVDTVRAAGKIIPPGYAFWADLIGNPPEPFSQALVYKEISAFEVRMHPTLENETPRLFAEPEVEPWFFLPDKMQKWLRQLAQPAASRLIVTMESEADRTERIMREAVKELLPPPAMHGLKRRLEETAYLFLRTGREAEARRAVQAAVTIEEERPLRPPHPFLRALIDRSLRIALDVERSAYEPMRLGRV